MEKSLAQLKNGESAVIKQFDDVLIPLKLMELGCLPGNLVTRVYAAPLNDPIYFIINDTHLAIRKETARHIIIES